MPSISLVTRFKDRLSFLAKTLRTWVAIPDYTEIIIVDWDSNEDILPFIKAFNDPRIRVVRVNDQDFFERGAAWNIGIKYAKSEFIHCVDCDVKLDKDVLKGICFEHNIFYTSSLDDWYIAGMCFITKEMWNKANGYVENLETYGCEDIDFINRIKSCGYFQKIYFNPKLAKHIEHTHKVRFINCKKKFDNNTADSIAYNKKILENIDWSNYKMKDYEVEVFDHNGKLVT